MTTIIAVSFLVYCTLARSLASSEYAPFFMPGNLILSYLPSWSLQFSWGMVGFFHGFESLYVLYLCKKHRTGFFVGVSPRACCRAHTVPLTATRQAQYVLAALMLGFPVISDMRKQVQDARIDSILKGK